MREIVDINEHKTSRTGAFAEGFDMAWKKTGPGVGEINYNNKILWAETNKLCKNPWCA